MCGCGDLFANGVVIFSSETNMLFCQIVHRVPTTQAQFTVRSNAMLVDSVNKGYEKLNIKISIIDIFRIR